MGFKKKDSEKIEHNFTWINLNRITARDFAQKHCPFSHLMKQINKKLDACDITPEEIYQLYDPNVHSVLKIKSYDTRIEFSLVWAKNLNKSPQCCPLGYEYDPHKYGDMLSKGFWTFKERLDNV